VIGCFPPTTYPVRKDDIHEVLKKWNRDCRQQEKYRVLGFVHARRGRVRRYRKRIILRGRTPSRSLLNGKPDAARAAVVEEGTILEQMHVSRSARTLANALRNTCRRQPRCCSGCGRVRNTTRFGHVGPALPSAKSASIMPAQSPARAREKQNAISFAFP